MKVQRYVGVVACIMTMNASHAFAQQQSAKRGADNTAAATDEIIVTAQKREQSVMDVGLSITSASAAQLEKIGVTDISRLTQAVSGFTIATSTDNFPVFTIRGIGYNANQLSAAPTVTAYVDEAPLPYLAMTGGVTLDLERVEVLKGPQGTLFGNNSTGGSINFIAAKPTNEMSAGLRSSYDRFGQFFVEGFVSGPVTGNLKARAAASTTQGGDWQRSYTPGPRLRNGKADRGAERVILDWHPSASLKVSLNLNHYFDNSDPQALQFFRTTPSAPGSAFVDPIYGSSETYPLPPHSNRAADFSLTSRTPFVRSDRQYQSVLRMDLDIGETTTLTSISNYAHLRSRSYRDLDGTRIDIVESGNIGTIETYGEELRLAAELPDLGLNLLIGGNYAKDKIHEEQPQSFPHFVGVPPGIFLKTFGDFRSEQIAGFANADWEITDQITLTGGLRYTKVKQADTSCLPDLGDGSVAAFLGSLADLFRSLQGLGPTTAYVPGGCGTIGPGPDYLPFLFDAQDTDHNLSWRAGLNFKPSRDMLLYALISRGYKAGGYPFNNAITNDQYTRVRQERVNAYEVGSKYALGQNLMLNAAAYYYQYKDKQTYALSSVPLFGPISVLTNLPKSKAYGFEAEATIRPVERLTLHGQVTYMRSKIIDPGPGRIDSTGQPLDLRGNPLAYAPRWTSIFDAEYRFPFSADLDGVIGGNGTYNSKAFADLASTEPFALKSYMTFDARIGLESRAGWNASAWIRNIGNSYYWTGANFLFDGVIGRTTGQPRNYGLTVAYRF